MTSALAEFRTLLDEQAVSARKPRRRTRPAFVLIGWAVLSIYAALALATVGALVDSGLGEILAHFRP